MNQSVRPTAIASALLGHVTSGSPVTTFFSFPFTF
jgi:hypothetical protein